MAADFLGSLTIPQRFELLKYAQRCAERHSVELGELRTRLEYRDRAYQRQLAVTSAELESVRKCMQNPGTARMPAALEVPIVMPQVESAVAYQAGVFLTSYPIFGVVSTPSNQDAALQFESALGDQSTRYGWARELIKSLRRGFKYNFAPTVISWKNTPASRITTDSSTDADLAGRARVENYRYSGNCIKSIDPYNCFLDMVCHPSELHKDGEFFGYNELLSRVQLKQLIASLDATRTTHAREAFESSYLGAAKGSTWPMDYYTPTVNQYMDIGGAPGITDNWSVWVGLEAAKRRNIQYKSHYLVTHFYCRALPSDFGGRGNTVKCYHAIIVNWSHVIFVEELNVGYDLLPVIIATPNDDGLGYQTQSMIDNTLPYQDMSSSLWNITLESQRRAVFDRLVYNPKLIDPASINPASSVSRIPLRNAAASRDGNDISKAIYQIPYRMEGAQMGVQLSDMVSAMADDAAGQNKVDRGQFQKGNKTKTEFETTMGNSNSRQQLVALSLEQQFFQPMKEIVKAHTLQFQPSGKILNREQRQEVEVDPIKLRESMLEFKLTDGNLPAEKMLNSNLLTVFMQTAQALPGVATEYDVMGMFLYWAKLQGAYWLEDFKRDANQQQQFLQTMAQTTAAQTPPQAPQGQPGV